MELLADIYRLLHLKLNIGSYKHDQQTNTSKTPHLGAEPGIFPILCYDINAYKLFFKINH